MPTANIKDFIGRRILVSSKYGYLVEELKVLEVSPAGTYVRVMDVHGRKYWRGVVEVLMVEALTDFEPRPRTVDVPEHRFGCGLEDVANRGIGEPGRDAELAAVQTQLADALKSCGEAADLRKAKDVELAAAHEALAQSRLENKLYVEARVANALIAERDFLAATFEQSAKIFETSWREDGTREDAKSYDACLKGIAEDIRARMSKTAGHP
jgi:fructose-specific phosphotransferase system component IIB